MKKIKRADLKHGDVYKDNDGSDMILVYLTPFSPDNFKNPDVRNTSTSLDEDRMWYFDPKMEGEEYVYLITTLRDIGEIIEESLKNE